jgi:phthiocerol/phenolphthiocerol synthesis type-I polyketide synthase E
VLACLSGVFSLEDALWLVAKRGEMMQEVRTGAMVAVMMSEAEAEERIKGKELSIAAVNGPRQVVISGESEAIERMIEELRQGGRASRKLPTRQAYHSMMMEEVASRYVEEVRKVSLRKGGIEYISNVSGRVMSEQEMTSPSYWGRQIRERVRFGPGIEELTRKPGVILLEVGPGTSLSRLARGSGAQEIISTMGDRTEQQPDCRYLTTAIGKLWTAGVEIDWGGYNEGERRRRVGLPTYPFERQKYWIEAKSTADKCDSSKNKENGKKGDIKEWFYVPGWQRRELPPSGESAGLEGRKKKKYVVMGDDSSVSRRLVEGLKREAAAVIFVKAGECPRKICENEYEIRPGERLDYEALLEEVMRTETEMIEVVHLWGIVKEEEREEMLQPEARFRREQQRGFYSLLFLSQGLAKLNLSIPIKVYVICNNLHQVSGEEEFSPEKSTLLAFCKVISQESSNIACRSIEIVLPAQKSKEEVRLIERLIHEIETDSPDVVVAYRGNRRWAQSFEPLHLERCTQPIRPLRVNGVYLITGGLGGVGLLLAEYLARTVQAKLVLTGRSFFPERSQWTQRLKSHSDDDQINIKIQRLQAMEAAGAEIMVASIDVTDEDRMQAVVANALQQYGALHGVMHAAGVTSGPSLYKPFTEMSIADTESQFQPKAYGVYVLERVLRNIDIDFCLLFSSNASVLGGLGLMAYSAANMFMDAFASSRSNADRASHSAPWISATWDPWPEETKKYTNYQTSLDQYTMTAEESLEAFNRLVTSAPEGQVVVSTGDLRERLDMWVNRTASNGKAQPMSKSRPHPRPKLESLYIAPRDSAEQTIAGIWQETLGLDQVGVEDDFFNLGGHSLLAIELMGRLRDVFQIDLPVGKFFETPTVAGLAQAISEFQREQQDPEGKELLKMLSQLSDNEVESEIERQTIDL